jgi:iron(III) transport system permease protein
MSAVQFDPMARPPVLASRWALASEAIAARGGVLLLALSLFVFLTVPLAAILLRSVDGRAGEFVGLANFATYVSSPGFGTSVANTLNFALLTTLITVPVAFGFAFAMQRACLPWRGLWRNIALIPILAPSLLPALSFLYLFGNQGWLNFMLGWFGIESIYGMPGMVMSMCFASVPHAVMILMAALALSDARLYEAAESLGTSEARKFFTITLPGAKYGLISATLVVFTMAVSEFGVPKVIGGNTNVLAIDIYKQVVGQQNFSIGAVVAVLLLLPALAAFAIDRVIQGRQKALLSARSVPYAPRPAGWRDGLLLSYVLLLSLAMLVVMGMAVFGSFVQFWPYDLSFTLRHYVYGLEEAGIDNAYANSLQMALWTALIGTTVTFAGAYWIEKTGVDKVRGWRRLLPLVQGQALLPMAVPGMVLGIGYILFFNAPGQSSRLSLRQPGDPGAVDGRALLLEQPSDRGDRAQEPRWRVRIGVGVAEGAVLQDVLARHRAGVPAGDPRHRALLLRQCDDHHFGRGVPVWAADDADLGLDPATRRSWRAWFGRSDGESDRVHLGVGHWPVLRHRVVADAADSTLAQHRSQLVQQGRSK